MKKAARSWWRTPFEDDHARRSAAVFAAQAEGVDTLLALETRSRVLDLHCGAGRRTLALSARGHRVLGADPDERALAQARFAAKGEKLNVHFLKADPREVSYRAEFDAVLWLDGGFGSLEDDREDLRALEAVRKSLKPGGKLLIDVLNKEWLMRHFEANHWERGEDGSGAVVLDKVSFDFEKGRLDNHRTVVDADGRRSVVPLSVRLYSLTELIAQVERAGLTYVRAFGGCDGSAYGMDSPRLVVLAERPRQEKPPRQNSADDGLPKALRIKGRR